MPEVLLTLLPRRIPLLRTFIFSPKASFVASVRGSRVAMLSQLMEHNSRTKFPTLWRGKWHRELHAAGQPHPPQSLTSNTIDTRRTF